MNKTNERIGVCSWSLRPKHPAELIRILKPLSLTRVQLAMSPMAEGSEPWVDAVSELRAEGIDVVSGMFSPIGEDYRTLETIRRTGGVVPDEHWHANLKLATSIAGIAGRQGVRTVTFHAGFVPHDPSDPGYGKLRDRLVTLAGVFADAGSELLLETGQETADDLLAFLDAVDQSNLGVNFDPANMILYGKGDPIRALKILIGRVRQVHIKDATASTTPGQWGAEVPAGTGDVDWPAFFKVLKEARYSGNLVIEREAGNDRTGDIAKARDLVVKHWPA